MKKIAPLLLAGLVFFLGFIQGIDYRALHFQAIVVDTHNDVAQRMLAGEDISRQTLHGQSDLPRFLQGGLDIEVFSIWVPPGKGGRPYADQADEQIDSVESFVERNSARVGLARSAGEAERMVRDGKFVAMLGLEGGHPLGNSLEKLDHFYKRGVRYMTLTWNNSTSWATSARDESDSARRRPAGLTSFGRKVIGHMNRLGMLVDVSHVGERTFWDVMKVTRKPVIASHSSAWALCRHYRNLKDDQLKAIARNGGIVCVNFAPWFIDSTFAGRERLMREREKKKIDSLSAALKDKGEFLKNELIAESLRDAYARIRPPLDRLIDHFDYIARLIGADHVGIGSDFDGITVTPLDMDDVSYLPNITRELLKRGYSPEDVRKMLGENFLRVLRENEGSGVQGEK